MGASAGSADGAFDRLAGVALKAENLALVREMELLKQRILEMDLAQLNDLRRYLPEYFTYVLASDASGNVPRKMEDYSILGAPLESGEVDPLGRRPPRPREARRARPTVEIFQLMFSH